MKLSSDTPAGGHVPDDNGNTASIYSSGQVSAGNPCKGSGAPGHVPGITNNDSPFLHEGQDQRFHCGVVIEPYGPCISIYLPIHLGGGIDNCLKLYERKHLFDLSLLPDLL